MPTARVPTRLSSIATLGLLMLIDALYFLFVVCPLGGLMYYAFGWWFVPLFAVAIVVGVWLDRHLKPQDLMPPDLMSRDPMPR